MISKEIFMLIMIVFLIRIRHVSERWFYIGITWVSIFVAYCVTALLVNISYIPALDISLSSELFAITTLPFLLILLSYEKNADLAFKLVKFFFILNLVVIIIEITVGNALYMSGGRGILSKFNLVLRNETYPVTRRILGLEFTRPIGAFKNIHVSSFVLLLYYIFLCLEEGAGIVNKKARWLKPLIIITIFATNNFQTALCLITFSLVYHFPKAKPLHKIALISLIIILFIPIFIVYIGARHHQSVQALSSLFMRHVQHIDTGIITLGLQIHPLNLKNYDFLLSRGIMPSGLIFDFGPYLMLTRYGIVGIVLLLLFFITVIIASRVSREGRYLLFCLFVASMTTAVHYPVIFSATSTFVLATLIMYVSRHFEVPLESGA